MYHGSSHDLTKQIVHFKKTGKGLDELKKQISLLVYKYPRKRLGWDEDDASDFFCYFFPKIESLLHRFEYRGKPFEAYLVTTIKWQLKSFASHKALDKIKRRVVSNEQYQEVCESGEYSAEEKIDQELHAVRIRRFLKTGEKGTIHNPAVSRRILILAMKGVYFLNREDLKQVAQLTGNKLEWVEQCRDILWERLENRRRRIDELRSRRNNAYFRMHYMYQRLEIETETASRSRLFSILMQEKHRLQRAQKALSHVPKTPTHTDISEVLKIPKGSVDSSMYYLRNHCEGLMQN